MNNFGPIIRIPSGVPQGSVLGPFLFAAFMGSIEFPFRNVMCIKYADDVTIIEPLRRLQSSVVTLDLCETVVFDNGLYVNRSKCKQMQIFRSHAGHLCDGTTLTGFTHVTSMKVLGITFNNRFKWDAQITELLKCASRRLYLIRRLKGFVDSDNLVRVYHAVITAIFLYASPVYGCLPLTLLSKLEKFQKRAHRLVCGPSCECDRFSSVSSMFEDAAVKLLLQS